MLKQVAKMRITVQADVIYEAFVNPNLIGNFWFTSSSERWEGGKTVRLTSKEYGADFPIKIVEAEKPRKIVFLWGLSGAERTVTITITEQGNGESVVEVTEIGWVDSPDLMYEMLDNKEGWVFMLTCLKAYLENGVNSLRAGIVK